MIIFSEKSVKNILPKSKMCEKSAYESKWNDGETRNLGRYNYRGGQVEQRQVPQESVQILGALWHYAWG